MLYVSCLQRNLLAVIHTQRIGSHYRKKGKSRGNSTMLKMSVNGASTILHVVSMFFGKPFARWYP